MHVMRYARLVLLAASCTYDERVDVARNLGWEQRELFCYLCARLPSLAVEEIYRGSPAHYFSEEIIAQLESEEGSARDFSTPE